MFVLLLFETSADFVSKTFFLFESVEAFITKASAIKWLWHNEKRIELLKALLI